MASYSSPYTGSSLSSYDAYDYSDQVTYIYDLGLNLNTGYCGQDCFNWICQNEYNHAGATYYRHKVKYNGNPDHPDTMSNQDAYCYDPEFAYYVCGDGNNYEVYNKIECYDYKSSSSSYSSGSSTSSTSSANNYNNYGSSGSSTSSSYSSANYYGYTNTPAVLSTDVSSTYWWYP